MWVRRALGAGVLALIAAGCGIASSDQTVNTSPATSVVESTPVTSVPLVAGCPEEEAFFEGGQVAIFEQTSSDSDAIGGISWTEDISCEAFTFEFETSEGAPATTPPAISIEYLEDLPVVRVWLGTNQTFITDQLIETAMVERLFVVRGLDGNLFVDLHLASPAQAHASISSSPARLTIDLQPGIVDYQIEPTVAAHLVSIAPSDGATAPSPVMITGYARTFESTVLAIATRGDQVIAEAFTTAADGVDTWGAYEMELPLPPGPAALFIGEESPSDGGLQGVTIDISVE